MGVGYLIDSNTLIDFLGGLLPPNGKQLVAETIDRNELIISVITYIELLGFQSTEAYLQKCRTLVDLAEVIPLADSKIIEQTIVVRRETKIKLPDAIIAATALVKGLAVISRNEKDFGRVKGLNYINSYML